MTRFLHSLLISGMLALLVFTSIGYLAVRLSWQGYVRASNGTDHATETHQLFCLSTQAIRSLKWVEDDEFILNGSWYDVKHSITHSDGYTSLVVYADHWEKYWLDYFFSWDDQDSRNVHHNNASAPQSLDWYYWFPVFTIVKFESIPSRIDADSACRIIIRDFEDPPPKMILTA